MNTVPQRLIENIEPSKLKTAKRNSRTHSTKQIGKIVNSITHFGFTNPILIDGENRIIAGHGRVAAAIKLGLATVPCLRLSHLSDGDIRAYMVTDNKLALLGGWDFEILAAEFQNQIEQGYDMNLTGFELAEIDAILADQQDSSVEPEEPADEIPQLRPVAISRLGDCWTLGRHILVCGDAKDPFSIEALMGPDRADMVFADLPYNLKIVGCVSGLGQTQHREFAEASGEMSVAEYIEFLHRTLTAAASYCRNGAIAFTCIDWRHIGELMTAGKQVFSELKNVCVWGRVQRITATPSSVYRRGFRSPRFFSDAGSAAERSC